MNRERICLYIYVILFHGSLHPRFIFSCGSCQIGFIKNNRRVFFYHAIKNRIIVFIPHIKQQRLRSCRHGSSHQYFTIHIFQRILQINLLSHFVNRQKITFCGNDSRTFHQSLVLIFFLGNRQFHLLCCFFFLLLFLEQLPCITLSCGRNKQG